MRNLFDRKSVVASYSDVYRLIKDAERFPRYKPHRFRFRDINLCVTDFLSVAWQLKEIIIDEELKFISDKKSPYIIDCGSNAGVSVIYFCKLYPGAEIIAFEPDPEVFKCLIENINSNNITSVNAIEKVVWVNDDGVSFGSDSADSGSVYSEKNKHVLPSMRLKDLLSEGKEIDLLKIDIEGAEVPVLEDCKDDLSGVKNIYVEYHSWQHLPQRLDVLLNLLSKAGFRYYIRSLAKRINPFIERNFENGMDIQLNIHAIRN